MPKPSRIVAIEEHFYTRDFAELPVPAIYELGMGRIEVMDRAGIDIQVLSLAGPGIQGERDVGDAIAKARRVNDMMAELAVRFPGRYAGFACLPTQDPAAASDELERAVGQLGLKGCMIHAHTHGHYLDEDRFAPLWERLEALDVPLYLHPAMTFEPWHPVSGYPEMIRAAWAWGCETGAHALRIILSGTFDRFPAARMILGHMGEMLPLYAWRIDTRLRPAMAKRGLALPAPSDYLRRNMAITTSGVCDDAALACAITHMGGTESILFAVDYPYEESEEAVHWLKKIDLPAAEVEALAHGNAERLLKL